MSHHQTEAYNEHIHENHCEECDGKGWIECCPTGSPIMWPEIPMCSRCKEWSIDTCETCKGKQ